MTFYEVGIHHYKVMHYDNDYTLYTHIKHIYIIRNKIIQQVFINYNILK